MREPVLGVWFTIKCGALYVNVSVIGIEIDVFDSCRLACRRVNGERDKGRSVLTRNATFKAGAREKRRSDEVNVLAWVWEDAHHC